MSRGRAHPTPSALPPVACLVAYSGIMLRWRREFRYGVHEARKKVPKRLKEATATVLGASSYFN